MTVPDTQVPKQVSASPCLTPKDLRISGNIPITLNDSQSLKSSTDSGIAGCRGKCSCPCSNRNSSSGFSSQSSTSSNSSTSTNNSCCCSQASPKIESSSSSNNPLYKSNSCSTLPNMLLQAGHRVQTIAEINAPVEVPQRCAVPLQKTSSCSSLASRGRNVSFANVPVYSDSMMHVYAQVASVIPDSVSQTSSHKDLTSQRIPAERDHIYDTVRSPPVAVPLRVARPNRSFRLYEPSAYNSSTESSSNSSYQPTGMHGDSSYGTKDMYGKQSVPAHVESLAPMHNNRIVALRRENQRYNPHSYGTVTQRPATVNVHGSDRPNGYLKSALKQPKTASHQNVFRASEHHPANGDALMRIPSEAEYAMVDRSKKNRFTSLPALNQYSSTSLLPEEEKDQPPVPPKKNLHKSEFHLNRSRSSSPKKGFREKMNDFTKSAKNAFQRAFSTERIYRPEREERLEATGQQGFHRSKSFIKGLRASLSKKRKKNKPPLAEVVPQASCNPIWDEHPSGPNSPIHVRGQLLQLNLDGSQVVELSKPPNKPYGFFVARGRVRNSRGVFVSRMRDQETQKQLAGLLDIGDEILEIEGHSVKEADIIEVNNLMANKNTLLLTVLPYICRKDI